MLGKRKKADSGDVHADQEVDETLGLLDAVPAQAPPFFATRLQARLIGERGPSWKQWVIPVKRPGVAFAAVLLLFAVNLYCVWRVSEQMAQATHAQAAASLAEEYEFTIDEY